MAPGGQGWPAQHLSLMPIPMSGITDGFIIVLPTEQSCPGPSTLLAGQPLTAELQTGFIALTTILALVSKRKTFQGISKKEYQVIGKGTVFLRVFLFVSGIPGKMVLEKVLRSASFILKSKYAVAVKIWLILPLEAVLFCVC